MTDVVGTGDEELPPFDPLATFRFVVRRGRNWAGLLAIALVALAASFGARASWGDVATWVLAVTSLMAFAAAGFAGLVAYAVLNVELGRDRQAAADRARAEEERRRGQANRIAAWYEERAEVAGVPGSHAAPVPVWISGAMIRNASDLPVYDVRVSFSVPLPVGSGQQWRPGTRYPSHVIHMVIPGAHRVPMPRVVREAGEREMRQVLEALAAQEAAREPDESKRQVITAPRELAWLAAIEFEDAAGVRWVRDERGGLSQARAHRI